MTMPANADATKPLEPRERVLEAAVRCFRRSGFHTASMQQICAEARMSPGGVYRYFPSKEAIIEAIAEAERNRSRDYFGRIGLAESTLDGLIDTGCAYIRDAADEQQNSLCVEVLAEAQRNPRVKEMFQQNADEVRSLLRGALEAARGEGMVDPDIDLDTAASVLLAIGDGLMARMPLEGEGAFERIEPGLRELVKRMLAPCPMKEAGTPSGQGR